MPCTAALPALGGFRLQNTFSYPRAEASDNILKLPWTSRFNISISCPLSSLSAYLFIIISLPVLSGLWMPCDLFCCFSKLCAFYFQTKWHDVHFSSALSLYSNYTKHRECSNIQCLAKAERCMLLDECVIHIITFWAFAVNTGFSDGLYTHKTLKGYITIIIFLG